MASTRGRGVSPWAGLALIAMVMVVTPGASAAKTTFEGVLDSTSGHEGTLYTVELKNGTTVLLPERPVSDYNNGTVPLLATIRVTCTLAGWRAEGLVANCTDLSPVTVLATQSADANAYKVTALTRETTTGVTYGFMMALVRMPNCPGFSQPITADDVTKVFKETNDIIQQCSYNKMSINLNQLEVVPVTLPCTPAVRSAMLTCDDMALRSMALQAMGNPRGRVGSLHLGMVLPTGASCRWAALAQVGAPFTWYMPINYGIKRAGTVVQELLHNFGLYHSSTDTGVCTCEGQANCRCHVEYGDESTPMGEGDACLNAPEAYRLNWATAIASLDATSLVPGTSATYDLPAIHTSQTNMVIVKANWLTPYTKNLYFSLRVKAGADRLLANTFNGQVSVHDTLQAIDAISSNDNLGTHFLQTIKPNSELVMAPYKLVATTGALSGTSISLTLCRYESNKNECAGGASTRSPPAPSPPPPGGASGTCADLNTDCSYWKDQGFCAANSLYAPFMNDNCPQSCGKCADKCEDISPVCKTYLSLSSNICQSDDNTGDFMRTFCQKSCNTCGTAAAATVAAGQRCVDLSSACDVLKAELTCNPSSDRAELFMRANCQATCELCPVTANGASIADQPPLGCAAGYDVVGAKTLSTRRNVNLTACWDLCYEAEGCYLVTHDGSSDTCLLHTTLPEAVKSPKFEIVANASRTLCLVGTDQPSSAPDLLQWFYCTDGLDISGSLVSIQADLTNQECASACNATAACRLYTLLDDGSCVLKSNLFGGDLGTNAVEDGVAKSCVQTFYTNPASSSSSRRRRALADPLGQRHGQAIPARPYRRSLLAAAQKHQA